MTRRNAVVIFFSSAILAAATSLASPPPQDSDFSMEGKITDKSAGKLTISSGDNIIFHIVYSDSTLINKKDGSAGTEADLKIGVAIVVTGDLAESGVITAKKISIQGDAEKP